MHVLFTMKPTDSIFYKYTINMHGTCQVYAIDLLNTIYHSRMRSPSHSDNRNVIYNFTLQILSEGTEGIHVFELIKIFI